MKPIKFGASVEISYSVHSLQSIIHERNSVRLNQAVLKWAKFIYKNEHHFEQSDVNMGNTFLNHAFRWKIILFSLNG